MLLNFHSPFIFFHVNANTRAGLIQRYNIFAADLLIIIYTWKGIGPDKGASIRHTQPHVDFPVHIILLIQDKRRVLKFACSNMLFSSIKQRNLSFIYVSYVLYLSRTNISTHHVNYVMHWRVKIEMGKETNQHIGKNNTNNNT